MSKEKVEAIKRIARDIQADVSLSEIERVLRREFWEVLELAQKVSISHGPHYCGTCENSVKLHKALEKVMRP